MKHYEQIILSDCLATGKGIDKLLDICNKNNWTDSNTLLIVADTSDVDSQWWVTDLPEVWNE